MSAAAGPASHQLGCTVCSSDAAAVPCTPHCRLHFEITEDRRITKASNNHYPFKASRTFIAKSSRRKGFSMKCMPCPGSPRWTMVLVV